MNIETKLIELIVSAIKEKYNIEPEEKMVMVEIPREKINGDFSTNIAMRLCKSIGKKPQEIANELKETLLKNEEIEKIEVAGAGFINFWVKKTELANIIDTIINEGNNYGSSNTGNGLKVLEEYVSANPTGPLHCGHARGAVWGDSCVRIMKKAGYEPTREYYINDAGSQILNLGKSLYARYRELYGLDFVLPEDGYHGPDVIEIAKQVKDEYQDKFLNMTQEDAVNELMTLGRNLELERIKKDLEYYGCEFDSWVSELWIRNQGMVDEVIDKMNNKNLLYEQDGALWFKSTQYGDDKDRVLKKSDGYYTYLTPDIANHIYKYQRGYEVLVNIWGADHHGYVPRMKAALEALGYSRDNLQVDICQMVRMIENGEEVKMSKRTGNAITIRELIDDIGVDCTRYFFLSKNLDSQMDFDLTLAKTQSNDNPVYYIQYAYARICSILAQKAYQKADSYDLLTDQKEVELLKHLSSFTDVVSDSAKNRTPNKICNYSYKLATYFHSFYGACKVIDKNNDELTKQRIALLKATQITLKNALDLLGVSAPEHMENKEA